MPKYEHVVDGEVTERVTTVDGSPEDTRIGCAAIDREPGADGWRVEGTVDPEPTPDPPADPPVEEKAPPKPKPAIKKED